MRLNPDCIRDILISFKDKIDLSIPYIVNEANCKDICDKYSSKELCYHVRQCLYHGFITGTDKGNCIEVKGISPVGHDFLSYFYNEKDWIEINKIADKAGSHSLEALIQISIIRKIKEIEMKNRKGGNKLDKNKENVMGIGIPIYDPEGKWIGNILVNEKLEVVDWLRYSYKVGEGE